MPVWAQSHVSTGVNLNAGPRVGYPTLHVLRRGFRIEVHGCLDGYSWCDVSALGYGGWVYANCLDYNNGSRRVAIANYGPQIGITVIAFGLMNYWSQHYRQRPWYSERNTYEARFGPHGDRRPGTATPQCCNGSPVVPPPPRAKPDAAAAAPATSRHARRTNASNTRRRCNARCRNNNVAELQPAIAAIGMANTNPANGDATVIIDHRRVRRATLR